MTIPKELKDCNATHGANYSKELNVSLGCFSQDKVLNGDFNGDGINDQIFVFFVKPNLNSDQDLESFQRYRLILLKISSTKGNNNHIRINDSFAPYDAGYQDYIFDANAKKNDFIVHIEGGSGQLHFNYRFTFKKLMLYKIHYNVSYSRINPQKCQVDKTIYTGLKPIQNVELFKYVNKYNQSLPENCYSYQSEREDKKNRN